MSHKICLALIVGFAALKLSCAPASADGPLSIYAGTGLVNRSDFDESIMQVEVALGYDLGPKTTVPVRFRADIDYAFDSNTAASTFNAFGAGVSARLTTPTYFGAGVSLESVTAAPTGFAFPVFGGGSIAPVTTSATGIGGRFFVGQRVLAVKDLGLSIEASYKFLPNVGSTNVSAFGAGLRANF